MNEDKDPLFVRCGVFGRLWSLVANQLEFEIVSHGFLYERLVHFGALGDYLKRHRGSLNIIWFSTLWIIWRECDGCILSTRRKICKLYVRRLNFRLFCG